MPGGCAPGDSPDAREQLVRGHALAHVVVRAQVEQLRRHRPIALARDDDDRRVRLGADDAHDLRAIEPGHGQIEQHDVYRLGSEAAQRLFAVVRGNDPVTGLAQYRAERPDPRRLVVDDEQRQCR